MLIKKNSLPKTTLSIGGWHSKCLACGNNALPSESSHETRVGWDPGDGVGCGVTWTHVTSEYAGEEFENTVKGMCPDLVFIREYEVNLDDGCEEIKYVD